MIRTAPILLATAAALLAAAPACAQSQDELDARYDRALAAGYKALMLCSAIANAERAGAERTPESVERWELAGIQAPLDTIVGELPYKIERTGENPPGSSPQLRLVEVQWADDMAPRIAMHDSQKGCHLQPVGAGMPVIVSLRPQVDHPSEPTKPFTDRRVQAATEGAFGENYGEGARTTGVLVTSRGAVLGERYAADFGPDVPQRTWSVAKSIAATLVGAAVQRGETTVDGKLPNGLPRAVVPAWSDIARGDPRARISLDNLLRMASGRYSDTPGNRTDPLYFGGTSVEESAGIWPLIHQPGTVFRYANNDTLMAVKSIANGFEHHPPSELFARLGMHDIVAETDWRGDYILSSQVWSTARDLARLGQLYLDDGVLSDGTRILPEGWVKYVSSPSGPQPDGPLGYGAGFWLFDKSDGIPPDTFAAMGNRGQYVVIVPSRHIVIVRRGEDPVGARFDIVAFTRDVLAALPSP